VALVSDKADSPHLAPQRTDARLDFGCAEHDSYAPLPMIDQLRAEIGAKGGNAEVEIYPGTAHGFAFPSRPAYDKPAAERHWERLFTLFGDALK
jgi:carboxymethylenebutenolidase